MILASRLVQLLYVISPPRVGLAKSVDDMTLAEVGLAELVAQDVLWMPANISLLVMVAGIPVAGLGLMDQAWFVAVAGLGCIIYGTYFWTVVAPAARRLARECRFKLEAEE